MDQTKRKRLSSGDKLSAFLSNKRTKTTTDAPLLELPATRPPGRLRRMASRDPLNSFFNKNGGASTANPFDQPGNRHSMFEMSVPYEEIATAQPQPVDMPPLKRPKSLAKLLRRKASKLGLVDNDDDEPNAVSPTTVVAGPEISAAGGAIQHVHVDGPGEWAINVLDISPGGVSYETSPEKLSVRAIVRDAVAHNNYTQTAANAPKLAAAQGNPPRMTVPLETGGSYIYTNESGVPWPADVQDSLAAAAANTTHNPIGPQTAGALVSADATPRTIVRRQRAATCIGCEVKNQQLSALQWQLDLARTGHAADPVSMGIDVAKYGYHHRLLEDEKRIDSCMTEAQSATSVSSGRAFSVAMNAVKQDRMSRVESAARSKQIGSSEGATAYRQLEERYMSGGFGNSRSSSIYSTDGFPPSKPDKDPKSDDMSLVHTTGGPPPTELDEGSNTERLMSMMSITSAPFVPDDLDTLMAALNFADNGEESWKGSG